ncbi:hypothetical protein ElyMa_002608800 [Elysia marginata]|uniref:Uncharacterized protein n=1 Tax=Elysia marginata TaxID=1093978 RepID=A0AAV4H3F4_9GAST|nr:hypothetical protein ElyMa_002608800 [Elysia marginata]
METSILTCREEIQSHAVSKENNWNCFLGQSWCSSVRNLQPGETINAARYCQTLDKLREAIRRKRPGVILHSGSKGERIYQTILQTRRKREKQKRGQSKCSLIHPL